MHGPENKYKSMKRSANILTFRENEIAGLIAWGFVQKEIADKLHMSVQTVSVHLRHIYSKLQIHKETDLTRWWIFKTYSIGDPFLKAVVVILFLSLTSVEIFTENCMVRSLRVPAARYARAKRSRRYENVYDLALID